MYRGDDNVQVRVRHVIARTHASECARSTHTHPCAGSPVLSHAKHVSCVFLVLSEAAGIKTGPLAAIVNIFIFNGVKAAAMGNREGAWKKPHQHMEERFVSSGDVRAPDMCQLQLTLSHLSVFYSCFSLQDLGQRGSARSTTSAVTFCPSPPRRAGQFGSSDQK